MNARPVTSPARPAPARRLPRPHRVEAPSALARLRAFDDALLRRVVAKRGRVVAFLLTVLCRFADPDVVGLVIVCLALGGQPVLAENLGFALLSTAILTQTVKRTVRRARPSGEVQALVPPDRYSFPSGHTAAAFAIALTLTGLVPELVPVAIAVAFLIGFARMYLGVHYPVDVVCGAAIGMFTGSLAALLPPVSEVFLPLVAPMQATLLGLA